MCVSVYLYIYIHRCVYVYTFIYIYILGASGLGRTRRVENAPRCCMSSGTACQGSAKATTRTRGSRQRITKGLGLKQYVILIVCLSEDEYV